MMQTAPIALQLRYLQTMSEVAEENTSYAFFPLPMDFVEAFKAMGKKMDVDVDTEEIDTDFGGIDPDIDSDLDAENGNNED
ncbi:MAG: hypothetical protein U5K69_27345 [Balneolaceae bacterium]|nr:hypothetical protein [Balneolaceae bacterium]